MQETQETWVCPLSQEDSLEESITVHSSILSCLENPKDRGAWCHTVYRVAKSRTRLKQLSTHCHISSIVSGSKIQLTRGTSVTDETICRAGIETQIQRTDLWTQDGEREGVTD